MRKSLSAFKYQWWSDQSHIKLFSLHFLFICKITCITSHVDGSSRGEPDLQHFRRGAGGAAAAVPQRASWCEADAPLCHSRSFTFSSLTQTSNVTSQTVCVQRRSPAVCRLQVQVVSTRLVVVEEALLLLLRGAAGKPPVERERRVLPAAQQQPGCDHRLCRDGNFHKTLCGAEANSTSAQWAEWLKITQGTKTVFVFVRI